MCLIIRIRSDVEYFGKEICKMSICYWGVFFFVLWVWCGLVGIGFGSCLISVDFFCLFICDFWDSFVRFGENFVSWGR